MELQARCVLIEACTFPFYAVIGCGCRADEGWKQIDWSVKGIEDWPRNLSGQQGQYVLGMKRRFQGVSSKVSVESEDDKEEEECEGGTRHGRER